MNQIKSTCVYMTYLVIYLISCLRSAGTKYLYIAQKHVHVCLMHVLNAKFVTQLRTQVQWFIFYAITQS